MYCLYSTPYLKTHVPTEPWSIDKQTRIRISIRLRIGWAQTSEVLAARHNFLPVYIYFRSYQAHRKITKVN
ncbi:hypothetical protein WN943_017201 [Citrus x changshan-huyou]